MLPTVREMALPFPETIIFMQDNYPIHTARVVRQWFQEQRNLELLPWPSNRPNLNPIENVWANIINVWEAAEERTPQQLWRHVQREWEVLRTKQHIIYNHVESVQRRLQCVIDTVITVAGANIDCHQVCCFFFLWVNVSASERERERLLFSGRIKYLN